MKKQHKPYCRVMLIPGSTECNCEKTIDELFGPVDPKTGKRQVFGVIGAKTGGKW